MTEEQEPKSTVENLSSVSASKDESNGENDSSHGSTESTTLKGVDKEGSESQSSSDTVKSEVVAGAICRKAAKVIERLEKQLVNSDECIRRATEKTITNLKIIPLFKEAILDSTVIKGPKEPVLGLLSFTHDNLRFYASETSVWVVCKGERGFSGTYKGYKPFLVVPQANPSITPHEYQKLIENSLQKAEKKNITTGGKFKSLLPPSIVKQSAIKAIKQFVKDNGHFIGYSSRKLMLPFKEQRNKALEILRFNGRIPEKKTDSFKAALIAYEETLQFRIFLQKCSVRSDGCSSDDRNILLRLARYMCKISNTLNNAEDNSEGWKYDWKALLMFNSALHTLKLKRNALAKSLKTKLQDHPKQEDESLNIAYSDVEGNFKEKFISSLPQRKHTI